MHLLRMQEDGNVSLEEHAEEDDPPYAILSHRWGNDYVEVTFKDIVENTGRDKRGYAKIRACGEQAKRDGHQLFWVDTCCIDKSSSAELSESINSMWRWYRNSQVCYAYLEDVPANGDAAEKDATLTASRWFTRGWTLQELLAPSKLVLYDSAWEVIGTKDELADEISKITNINRHYIAQKTSLLEYASVAERMSWASTRQTKRLEDVAYCLLGIFDINMPLLYGEGAKAFQRLQEEIVKRSDDQSILAWSSSSSETNHSKLFAHSPADFAACGDIVRSIQAGPMKPYAITNKGLQVELPIVRGSDDQSCAVLNCRHRNDTFTNLALPLDKGGHGPQYQRQSGELQVVPLNDWFRATVRSIYISMTPRVDCARIDMEDNTCILRRLPSGLRISQDFPPNSLSSGTRTLVGNRDTSSPQDQSNRTIVVVSSEMTPQFVFMTFFHKNRFFHDWVWDARLLPVTLDESSDIGKIFSDWKYRDLSALPRVQQSDHGVVALRTVPQRIQGRNLTTIDIVLHHPDGNLTHREIPEQALVVFRSCGHRLSRILYWIFDLVIGVHIPLNALLFASPLLVVFAPSLLRVGSTHSSLTVGFTHLLLNSRSFRATISCYVLGSLFYLSKNWDSKRNKRDRTRKERVGLTWRDIRNFDVLIGYAFVVMVPAALLFLIFGSYVGLSLSFTFLSWFQLSAIGLFYGTPLSDAIIL
jgi:hypothetical protein